MKFLISCDMEGLSGVIDWKQVDRGTSEYERFCQVLTAEVNAAITGAYKGGAVEVAVVDGHDTGRNIHIEDLDPRATLHYGANTPLSVIQGVQQGVDGVILVGYHARSGTPSAVLSHTWTSTSISDVWLNDALIGEIGLIAAVSGYYGVPVIFISGDQAACNEAANLIPGIESTAVKKAAGRYSAECLPLTTTQNNIRLGVQKAVENFRNGQGPAPYKVRTPVKISIRFATPFMAEQALILPQLTAQPDGRTVSFESPDIVTAFQMFRAASALVRPTE